MSYPPLCQAMATIGPFGLVAKALRTIIEDETVMRIIGCHMKHVLQAGPRKRQMDCHHQPASAASQTRTMRLSSSAQCM